MSQLSIISECYSILAQKNFKYLFQIKVEMTKYLFITKNSKK